jgi:hypothetical protein
MSSPGNTSRGKAPEPPVSRTVYTTYDTRRLTRSSFEPAAVGRIRAWRPLILAALAAVFLAGATMTDLGEYVTAPVRAATLEERNAALTEELRQARVELEMERATRASLEQQLDQLNGQVSDLTSQLEFLNSRYTPARRID